MWRVYEKDGKQGVWRIDASLEDVQTRKVEKHTWYVPQCLLRRTDENDGPGQAEIRDLHKYIRDRLGMSSARQFMGEPEKQLPLADFGYKQVIDDFAPQKGQKSYGYGKRKVYEEEPKKTGQNKYGWRQ